MKFHNKTDAIVEGILSYLEEKKSLSQQELFPQNITLSHSDADILIELEDSEAGSNVRFPDLKMISSNSR